jgi:hypothetical protein
LGECADTSESLLGRAVHALAKRLQDDGGVGIIAHHEGNLVFPGGG